MENNNPSFKIMQLKSSILKSLWGSTCLLGLKWLQYPCPKIVIFVMVLHSTIEVPKAL